MAKDWIGDDEFDEGGGYTWERTDYSSVSSSPVYAQTNNDRRQELQIVTGDDSVAVVLPDYVLPHAVMARILRGAGWTVEPPT